MHPEPGSAGDCVSNRQHCLTLDFYDDTKLSPMKLRHNIHRFSATLQVRQRIALLRRLSPQRLGNMSETAAVRSFHRALRRAPAYAAFCRDHGIDADKVDTIEAFRQRVPVLDKSLLLERFDVADLSPDLAASPSGRVWSSSGSSGRFTLGFDTPRKAAAAARATLLLLQYGYGVLEKKTLFINSISTPWPLSVPFVHHADVGTRSDLGAALLCKMGAVYDQFIIGGEPLLVKKLLEEAIREGVDFKTTRIHLILGGEYVAESLRDYFSRLINPDGVSDTNTVLLTMGMAELGVGLFFELPNLARIRAAIAADAGAFPPIVGERRAACPQLFHYNPLSVFVETVVDADGDPHFVLTDLSPDAPFPLVRFDTGDLGRILDRKLLETLRDGAGGGAPPSLPFPVVAALGRAPRIATDSGDISPDEVKEMLYAVHDLLPKLTGVFHLEPSIDGMPARVRVQLGPDVAPASLPAAALARLEHSAAARGLTVEPVPWAQLASVMGVRYERKFSYC